MFITNPPANICNPVSVTITGENNAIYPFNGISTSISGNNITINIGYSDVFGFFLGDNWSHNVDLGVLLQGAYNVLVNGIYGSTVTSTYYDTIAVGPSNLTASFIHPTSVCLGQSHYLYNSTVGLTGHIWYENGVSVGDFSDYSAAPPHQKEYIPICY